MAVIAFICKTSDEHAVKQGEIFAHRLTQVGHRVLGEPHLHVSGVEPVKKLEDLVDQSDLLFVFGGDGTLLYAASLMTRRVIPIVGINLGSLGFLTPFSPASAQDSLHEILTGRLPIVDRLRFSAVLLRDGVPVFSTVAANDVVINHENLARLLEITCEIDSEPFFTLKADGLILATPMGSTAYALAAGGPILRPGMDAMVVVPICPHQLTQRPMVIPASSEIILSTGQDGFLTVDGRRGCTIRRKDRLWVTVSDLPLRMVLPHNYSFASVLRHKLSWGARGEDHA